MIRRTVPAIGYQRVPSDAARFDMVILLTGVGLRLMIKVIDPVVGADVLTVPVYKWALPEDLAPLRGAVWSIIRHEVEIVILTASIQLVHLLRVGGDMGLDSALRNALRHTVVASIGPMTSEELRLQELSVDFEPSHPKMGFLVKELAEQCEALLHNKRCVESTTRDGRRE